MSEYIFSMDKPKDCYDCKLIKENDEKNGFYDCVLTGKACALSHVSVYCPLVEVPTHGRLIDVDKMFSMFERACCTDSLADTIARDILEGLIKNAPTVIEASKERE